MTLPEDALAKARAQAAARRAEGVYSDDLRGFEIEPTDRVTQARLLEWALIEPDPDLVYSTRRLGAPITWLKRGLLRLLRQYHNQALAQQVRFNIQLMTYVSELEERVRRLEESPPDDGPAAA
jgi:hypothetical protein